MLKMIGRYFFTGVLLLMVTHKGISLKCFECTTFFSEVNCGDDFDPEGIKQLICDDGDVCMTHKLPEVLHFPEITQRACVSPYYCSGIDAISGHCVTCSEDYCNSSSIAFPAFVLILLCLLPRYF